MQPIGHRRRSWNSQRLVKKARGGVVAVLASLPLLIFISLIYVVMLFERFVSRTEQRRFAAPRFTGGKGAAVKPGPASEMRHRSAALDPGMSHQPGLTASNTSPEAEYEDERALAEAADQARRESDRAIASNLALCRSPAAVNVIVEEAALRHEMHWPMMEAVFDRLIDLNALSDDVRSLMRVCCFEWLYEMQIKPRRFIRLKPQTYGGVTRWQHTARRLICFEFDGGTEHPELLPSFDILLSQTRVFFYFDDEDQVIGWERPREPRRRHL